jgi:hypothetical protein
LNSRKFIILYPYQFNDFLWKKRELDHLEEYIEIEVWDLTRVLNRRFSKLIYRPLTHNNRIIYFKNLLQVVYYIYKNIYKSTKRVYLFDKTTITNLSSLAVRIIINTVISIKNIKALSEYNPGHPLPSFYTKDNFFKKSKKIIFDYIYPNLSLIFLIYFVKNLPFQFLNKILPPRSSFLLVGCTSYKMTSNQVLYGHSWDFSEFLIQSTDCKKLDYNHEAFIVMLEGATPYFHDDKALTGSKEMLSVEVWYPLLNKFFEVIESKFESPVKVLGHYKSNFDSPSKVFDNREVFYFQTLDLVRKSKFVITTDSSSISFAVLFRKPILFIYSNQLKRDKLLMRQIETHARILGTEPININDIPKNLDSYLAVDKEKYFEYENKYLTSKYSQKPNYQIMLENFFWGEN